MFTGLIEEIGRVANVVRAGGGASITIGCERVMEGVRTGDSICINGACQTVTAVERGSFTVFASRVTASVTTLGSFAQGRNVNLERAMTPSSRFGGHFVQGHVDGRGRIDRIEKDPMGIRVRVTAGPDIRKYIVDKGSAAVDGISLTVVSCDDAGFALYIIPETVSNTIAAEWKTGDEVNIETDIIAKYVERMLRSMTQGGGQGENGDDRGLLHKLMEEGFV
jgi:riboflavin synthase